MTDLCTVSYEVYPPTGTDGIATMHLTRPPTGHTDQPSLHDILAQCLSVLQPLTARYIWQRDTLHLVPSTSRAAPWHTQQPPCLWGHSCVGESVQDEWMITALLRHITRAVAGTTARCERLAHTLQPTVWAGCGTTMGISC